MAPRLITFRTNTAAFATKTPQIPTQIPTQTPFPPQIHSILFPFCARCPPMADTPPFPTHTPEGIPIPAFTPWTGARRRGPGWTPHVQWLFIAALTRLGCVATAARAAGRSVRSAYRLRDKPGAESFSAPGRVCLIRGPRSGSPSLRLAP